MKIIDEVKGPNSLARQEWLRLEEYMKQFVDAAAIFPPCAIREDLGAVATTLGRYLPSILGAGPNALKLTSPFSEVSFHIVTLVFVCEGKQIIKQSVNLSSNEWEVSLNRK